MGFTAHAQYTIRWVSDPAQTAVEVEGIPRDVREALEGSDPHAVVWMQLLAVYAEQPVMPGAPMPPMPPMAGSWKMAKGKLRFEPRFPFTRGVAYRAEFWPSRLPGPLGSPSQLLGVLTGEAPQGPVISFFELPRDKTTPTTTVMQIYPTSDLLPENQLKFYVHFSGSMSRGGIYEYVQLRDGEGKIVDTPFLELDEELWDPTMTRLTLLIDPGRIKRGVKPLEDMGPVFEAGKNYTLSIKATWRDADGRPLKTGFEKAFRIGPADRTPPDPKRWKITYVPPAGSPGPFIVQFDEPMDRALALRLIAVERVPEQRGARPQVLDGEVTVDEQERRWMLMPVGPWRRGSYRLVVATTIEDLAGNNIGKTFDVDLAAGAQRQSQASSASVPFEVK
ncbi:MAG: hypothetical protein V4773_16810 [Verrucomicrobiota bacterium]